MGHSGEQGAKPNKGYRALMARRGRGFHAELTSVPSSWLSRDIGSVTISTLEMEKLRCRKVTCPRHRGGGFS